jgi:hypothetical protein
MKRVACIVFLLSAGCMAVEQGQVRYLGGTFDNSKVGAIGRLDLSAPESITFETGKSHCAILYERIVSYQYSDEVAHHLGVLPSIAVGLLKRRQHRHVFTIVYLNDQLAKQIVVFEVPKSAAGSVKAVLDAKGIHTCVQYDPCIRR